MPHFRVDFPSEISPFVDEVETSTRAFVRRFGLAPTEADLRHHERAFFATLMGRANPHAGQAELALVTDWVSTMLVLDDHFDETELGRDPAGLREVTAEIVSWLRPEGPADPAPSAKHPVTEVFQAACADLWARTCEYSSPAWRERLAGHYAAFFDGCVWEAENRRTDRIPGIDEYLTYRGRAFLMPYLDMVELTTHAEVPEEIYRLPEFLEMNQALSDADLGTNDLFSCEKEAALGDQHNLVVVYQHEHGTDLQTAADAVGAMTQGWYDRFTELSQAFPDQVLGDDVDPATKDLVRTHVGCLRHWLSGQLQWRFETRRADPARVAATGASSLANRR